MFSKNVSDIFGYARNCCLYTVLSLNVKNEKSNRLSNYNCCEAKFVAIILVLLVFFNAIFRFFDFSSDAFDFPSSKTG